MGAVRETKRSDSAPRRVLGIDPGTRCAGWGVVERRGRGFVAIGHGAFVAPGSVPLPRRLAVIAGGLRRVVEEHAPTEAAIEEAFHGRDARAALKLGEARGAFLLLLAEAEIPVTGYANNVVKRAVTGAGRASKERVRAMVVRLLGLEEPPERLDTSDALALALCHLQRGPETAAGRAAGGLPPRVQAALRKAKVRGRRR